MKSLIKVLVSTLVAVGLFVGGLSAQVVYPLTLNVLWNPSPISDAVTKYTLNHNGTIKEILSTSCGAVDCSTTIVVTSSNVQTISLTATNQFGTSLPETITFTATAPGRSTNVRIRVP